MAEHETTLLQAHEDRTGGEGLENYLSFRLHAIPAIRALNDGKFQKMFTLLNLALNQEIPLPNRLEAKVHLFKMFHQFKGELEIIIQDVEKPPAPELPS